MWKNETKYGKLISMPNRKFTIETEKEKDGRWLAEVLELPGVMAYGKTRDEAQANVESLALNVLFEKLNIRKAKKHGTLVKRTSRQGLSRTHTIGLAHKTA